MSCKPNIFWVPPEARWAHLQHQARQPTIGQLVDEAMAAIERDNPQLKGVLSKDYARPALDKTRLGQVIDLVSNIRIGDEEARSKDVLGRVYEYFLEQLALAEGRKGGEFLTPHSVVGLLVEMLEPYRGRVYDPCCGSGGMFVQSKRFIAAHQSGNGNGGSAPRGKKPDISIYGEESNYTTWRLAEMNLAIHGIVQPGSPVEDGVPIVRVKDIRDGRIATTDPLRVAPAIEARYSRTRLAGGELLLTLVGTVGEAAVAPESLAGWNTARAVAVVPVRQDIGAYWVKLALNSSDVKQIMDSRLNTTVQATLKYGVGLLLVSQRPSEVEATVLSQCNSWIVLRVTNESDREHVKAILPDSMVGLTKMLSGLRRQEAIFVGQAAMLPSRIMIRDLADSQLPKSNDIDFDKAWQSDAMSEDQLKDVANRWRYQKR